MDTKTPAIYLAEIAELGRQINVRAGLLAEKRQEKRELSWAAVQGDAEAIQRVRALATEIDNLVWSQELTDDALLTANRLLQEAESAERDTRIASLLGERDAVVASLSEGHEQIAAATDTLVELIRENRKRAHYAAKLCGDVGQEQAGQSFVRREARQTDGYVTMRLAEIGVQGVERPLVGRLRDHINATFGKKESV